MVRIERLTASTFAWSWVAVALFAFPVEGSGPTYVRYHFSEPKPLILDASRIAVRPLAEATAALVSAGLTVDPRDALPIPGWTLARFEQGERSGLEIEAVVARLARSGEIDFASPVFAGDDGGPVIVTPTLLVGFEANVSRAAAEALLDQVVGGSILDRDWANMPGAYRLASPSRDGFAVLAQANALAESSEVRFAEPDMIFTGHSHLIPNDPLFGNLWGIHNTGQSGGTFDMDMDGPEAWDFTIGSSSVEVVVIDTGVQQNHPDIHQITGTDLTSDGPGNGGPVNACDVHGTPVAGCVSATINNSLGVVGIAPGVNSASARTFISNLACDGSWSTFISWTVDALAWAESLGARVTNNSNGYGFTSASIEAKYDQTRAAGMVHFASAGNNGTMVIGYPASIGSVNAIAAIDRNGNLAGFSDSGPGLAFSGPGVSVQSTDRTGTAGYVNGDYVFVNGTSFASPYAAGVAALVLSADPSLTAAGVEQVLQNTARDLGIPGYDTMFGYGLVNARDAVQSVSGCVDDGFETSGSGGTDDSCFGAFINLASPQSHLHCDEDWVYFSGVAGATYRIETSNLIGGSDTTLALHQGCGPQLAFDDDSGPEPLASRIDWTAGVNGLYDVRIRQFNDDYQSGEGYDVTVTCIANCATTCVPDGITLCLPDNDRFRVTLFFDTVQGPGNSGDAQAIALDSLGITKGGILHFGDPGNPEVLVKVLDGCGINNRWWVFYAATTNVGFQLTVEDTLAGLTKVYTNPDVHPADTITDTQAFATCP